MKALLWASENPEVIAGAIRAYDQHRSGTSPDQSADEQTRLEKALTEIERDLEAMKKTMMTAIRAGFSEKDFVSDLEKLAERRKRVEGRLSELSKPSVTQSESKPLTEAEKDSAVINAVTTVLTASNEEYEPTDKQRVIATTVDRIEPTFDRTTVTVTLRTQTVYTVKISYTVSEGFGVQIASKI